MISVFFLGNPQVGKTSLISKLCDITPSAFHIPTEGIDHNYKVMMSKGQKTVVQFWDAAGDHKMNPVSKFYYQKANAFVVVFSLTDYKSFKSVKEWLVRIKKHGDNKARIILVGNKSDLPGEIPAENIENLRAKYKLSYYETSIRDSSWCQSMLKEITEKVIVQVSDDYVSSPLQACDESPKGFQNQPKDRGFSRSDLDRIEAKFDEEIKIMKSELSKIQNKELETPQRIELEVNEVTNRVRSLSMEKEREQEKKLNQLYQHFENFRNSIIEEMMQTKTKSKMSIDGALDEIEALKNRVRALEKVTPASKPTENKPIKYQNEENIETNEGSIDRLFEDINSLQKKSEQNEDRIESVYKELFEEMNTLRKKTEENDNKVNGMFSFVERELKQTESHLINELNEKLKDIAEVSFSKMDQQSESEYNPEVDKIIRELNDSIRRCIADTDDFYNNLRQEVNPREENDSRPLSINTGEQEDLYVHSDVVENVGEPLADFRPKTKFVSMSVALASSKSDEVAYGQEDKENISDNLQVPMRTLPKFKGKIESEGALTLKPKFHKLEKASKSFQEIQNNLLNLATLQNNLQTYKDMPMSISSPVMSAQDEIHRIWKTMNKFMESTKEELAKLKYEVNGSKKLNILQSKNLSEHLSVDDIKDILKTFQGEIKEDIAESQRDCETMCRGLRDMINNYYQDTMEKIVLNREHLVLLYNELKARFEEANFESVKTPVLEHVPSDITPQGTMSPAEDVSFELKMLDRKMTKSDKEKALIKENIKQAEKQYKENKLLTLEDKLNSFWETTSLIVERLAKLENKKSVYKGSTPSKEERAMPTLYWA